MGEEVRKGPASGLPGRARLAPRPRAWPRPVLELICSWDRVGSGSEGLCP